MKKFTKLARLIIARGSLVIMLALAVVMATSAVGVRADEDDKGKTTLTDNEIQNMFAKPTGAPEDDIFSDVNTVAENTAKSALGIVRTVGAFVIVGGVLITALKLGTGNPQKRQQAKEELGWKIGAAILFLGGLAVLVFANGLASSIAKALGS